MALEEELAANTAALKATTAALNRNSDLLDILTAKAKAGVAAAPKEVEAVKPAAPKEVEKEEAAPVKRGRAAAAPKAPKAPTDKEISTQISTFLQDATDDTEYETRRIYIKSLMGHFNPEKMDAHIIDKDKNPAPKLADLDDAGRQEAKDLIAAFANGDEFEIDYDFTERAAELSKPKRRRDAEDVA